MCIYPQSSLMEMITSKIIVFLCLYVKLAQGLPRLTSASFVNSFERISVTWDDAVHLDKRYRNCSAIFDNYTLPLLGTAPRCILQSHTSATVIPATDAQIKAGDVIGLNKANFGSPNGTINLGSNANDVSPFDIRIRGPTSYCECADAFLYFNIDMSSHASYGRMSFSWSIDIYVEPVSIDGGGDGTSEETGEGEEEEKIREPPDIDFPLLIIIPTMPPTMPTNISNSTNFTTTPTPTKPEKLTFRTTVRRQKHALNIKVNSSLLDNNGSYVLLVDGKNAFGESKKAQWILTYVENCTISVNVHRGSHYYRYEANTFYVDVTYPPCWSGSRDSKYKMSVRTRGPLTEPTPYVSSPTSNTWLAEPGAYNIRQDYVLVVLVETETSTKEVIKTTKEVAFTVTSPALSATLLGDYIESGVGSKSINSYLFDADMIDSAATYTSECSAENGGKCANANGGIVGKTYTYTYTFMKGKQSANATVAVKFVDVSMTTLVVFASKKAYSPQEEVVFSATIMGGTITGAMTYMWKCYDKYDASKDDIIPSEVVKRGSVIPPIGSGGNNQFRVASLQLPGNRILYGTVISCECQLTHKGGKTVKARGSALIETPLQDTVLHVFPLQGKMVETIFRLHANGWTSFESNKPLLFRFGYKMVNTSHTRYLSPWTSNNILGNVSFPLSSSKGDSAVDVFVEIMNARKATSYVHKRVKLSPPNPLPTTMPSSRQDYLKKYKATQYLYNILSLSEDIPGLAGKPEDEININISSYLDMFLSSPLVSTDLPNVVDFLSHFVEMSQGKVEASVLGRLKDVVYYIGNETRRYLYDVDYRQQTVSVMNMVNSIVKDEEIKKSVFDIHRVNTLLSTYAGRVCDVTLQITTELMPTFSIHTPLINMSAYRDNQIFTHRNSSVLTLTKDLVTKYSKHNCSQTRGCDTHCLTDIKYNMDVVVNNEEENGTYISDFHDFRLWRVGVFGRRSALEVKADDGDYAFVFPVTKKDVKFEYWDVVQCVLYDAIQGGFLPDKCDPATLTTSDSGTPEEVRCKCTELGFIAAVKPWTPPPVPGPPLNISVYFWDEPTRCTQRLFSTFKGKFIRALTADINAREKKSNGTFKMSPRRAFVGTCTPTEIFNRELIIIVNFGIKDDVYEMRNPRVEELITEIINDQSFKVKMAKVSVPLFDPNQTTPKPPPPTIPPIGEVDVDWMPIIIAVAVIFIFFIVLATLSCIYHSYLLNQHVFNKINSDKPEPEPEEEDEELKAKEEVMATVMDDVAFAGNEYANKNLKTSLWRIRYTKKIHPTSYDGSTHHSSSSDFYHESAMLDRYRLALDDSSDVEGSRPSSSRAELFVAQSMQAQEKTDGTSSPITEVEC